MKPRFPLLLLVLSGVFCNLSVWSDVTTPAASRTLTPADSLAHFVRDPHPWLRMPANSEQRQPVYLGSTPRELALKLPPADGGSLRLAETLRAKLITQTQKLRRALVAGKKASASAELELEAWPIRDDLGQLNWAFARWRPKGDSRWQWLDAALWPIDSSHKPAPFLPVLLDPANKQDFAQIFNGFLEQKELYDKPLFGDAIWMDPEDSDKVQSAWRPVDDRESYGKKLARRLGRHQAVPQCRILPQPARWNGRPATFLFAVDASGVKAPEDIKWVSDDVGLPEAPAPKHPICAWPQNFSAAYKQDILSLDGEQEAVFPSSGRMTRFVRKNSIDPQNQIEDVVCWLEERYHQLGIRTRRQEFRWEGVPQVNLIAIIPGKGKDASRRPVLMADHIDTAFCEDVFEKSGERVSAPGADDNLSATAVLLRAAEVLRNENLEHDVWLVHLTGEEFPADDLGARHFVGRLLRDRQDISGLVLMDMIGHRESPQDRIFQINPGPDEASLGMAKIALDSSARITRFQPVLRTRFDEKSYLYNTDGLIFSDAGYPVVYLNEHINRLENFFRKGYHHTTDTSKKIDWHYATDIGKVAIQTAATLAGKAD